jgi:hypothetical protein
MKLRHFKLWTPVVLAGLASGCSPPPAATPGVIPELAGRTAGAPRNCVTNDSPSSLRIVDGRTMLYGSGSTVWLNRLAVECPGVDSWNDILVAFPSGSQYCRGDIVKTLDRTSHIPGPSCILGDFIPYRR